MASKQGSVTPAFLLAAKGNPDGALASMFMAAFGVSLADLIEMALIAFQNKDVKIIHLALTSAVQIRAHVTFVGPDYAQCRTAYPKLVIEGSRPVYDIYNFGALHALGHLFCHFSKHVLGNRALRKAGSCITGEFAKTTEAGLINAEIAKSWDAEDIILFNSTTLDALSQAFLDKILKSMQTESKNFNSGLSGVTSSAPKSIT